jgi:hypothetical protein
MSRLLQLDHATSIASASKLGVITCKVLPSRRLQPVFSVSWYMPKLKEGYLKPVVDILPPFQNEFKVLFLFWLLCCGWKKIVMDAKKISTPTDNLETGQHFNHDIQRRLSYKSFIERKWWSISGSKNVLFLYDILIFSAASIC